MKEKLFDINKQSHSIKCKMYFDVPRSADAVVVCIHGFAGHRGNNSAQKFSEKLLSKYKNKMIICFDLPAHKDDAKKKLTLSDCDTYISLVLEYVREEYPNAKLYGHATSFGSYLALKYIKEHGNPFERIVLRSPAINMYDSMMERILTDDNKFQLDKGKDALVGFDNKVRIDWNFLEDLQNTDIREWDFLDFADDILIIQGSKDEIIPPEVVQSFAEKNVIECEMFEKADHRFVDPNIMALSIAKIIDFLNV